MHQAQEQYQTRTPPTYCQLSTAYSASTAANMLTSFTHSPGALAAGAKAGTCAAALALPRRPTALPFSALGLAGPFGTVAELMGLAVGAAAALAAQATNTIVITHPVFCA